jgi:hypothetical protein
MKLAALGRAAAISCVFLQALLGWVRTAAAAARAERDVETDHLDAFDDVGPRTLGVLFSAGGVGIRSSAPAIGAELDFVLGDSAALSLAAAWLPLEAAGYSVSVGAPLFPGRVPFHGLYVRPLLVWERQSMLGASLDIGGVGVTAGWELTWRPGLTMRLGGGVAYEQALGGDDAVMGASGRVQPVLDGAVGWAF